MSDKTSRVLVGNIQKFSVEDGPGIRSTVFLKGCPLNCKWCHNPELIDIEQQLIKSPNNCIGCGYCAGACPKDAISFDGETGISIDLNKCDNCMKCVSECYAEALRPVAQSMSVSEIMNVVEQDKGFYDKTGGGVTLSGGEVLMHGPVVRDIIREAAKASINVCLDTCGQGSSQLLMELAKFHNVTDILYDIKSVNDEIHKEYTGVSNELILANLELLAKDQETAGKINIRMPLITGVNDSKENLILAGELYEKLAIKKLTLLPYHNFGVNKERNIGGQQEEFQPPADERMEEIRKYFQEKGMDVEILGQL